MILKPEIQEVLVLEPDRICSEMLAQTIETVFPDATIRKESDPSLSAGILAEHNIDLFVVTVRSFDLDIVALLGVWADQCQRHTRVLVVTPNGHSALIAAVRTLPIAGIFDWNHGDMQELEFALRVVGAGSSYWSRTIRQRLPASARVEPGSGLSPMDDTRSAAPRAGVRSTRLPRRFRSPWWNTGEA